VRDVAEILDHWQHGRSIQAIAASLGLDRKTVRKYVDLAQRAGFEPGQRPPGGWGAWLDSCHPELNARGRIRPTVRQLDPLHDEIGRALEVGVSPTTVWRSGARSPADERTFSNLTTDKDGARELNVCQFMCQSDGTPAGGSRDERAS
jgi:hypothetical protein